jgi:hypothetical protein
MGVRGRPIGMRDIQSRVAPGSEGTNFLNIRRGYSAPSETLSSRRQSAIRLSRIRATLTNSGSGPFMRLCKPCHESTKRLAGPAGFCRMRASMAGDHPVSRARAPYFPYDPQVLRRPIVRSTRAQRNAGCAGDAGDHRSDDRAPVEAARRARPWRRTVTIELESTRYFFTSGQALSTSVWNISSPGSSWTIER